jgi:hypothetical protein
MIKGGNMEKRKGLKCVATFNKDNEVVGIVTFRRKLIIATKNAIYTYPPTPKPKLQEEI